MARGERDVRQGKYHGQVGRKRSTVAKAMGQPCYAWCYQAARRGLDPYHRWDECRGDHASV